MKTFITIAVLALALAAPLAYAGQSPGQGMHKGKMGKNSMQQMQAQKSMGRGK